MILCCGEALIDMIPVPQANGPAAFVPHPGGAVFNTALALGRLNVQAGLVSGVSTDQFGVFLTNTLSANRVATQHLIRSPRLTTLAMVHLDEGSATYTFYDENSAGRMVQPDMFPVVPDSVTTLFFGGISLAMEPAADAYATYLEQNRAGRVVMIDPNIRPGFIEDDVRYRARLSRMIAQTDILKISDEDLDWLIPDTVQMAEKVQKLIEAGPKIVLVTQGAKGAKAYFRHGMVQVDAVAANVVDTVGAGDTFNAGFLAGLLDRNVADSKGFGQITEPDILHALKLAAKVAGITVSRSGANPPWRSELID